jgi:hypothetical protein
MTDTLCHSLWIPELWNCLRSDYRSSRSTQSCTVLTRLLDARSVQAEPYTRERGLDRLGSHRWRMSSVIHDDSEPQHCSREAGGGG